MRGLFFSWLPEPRSRRTPIPEIWRFTCSAAKVPRSQEAQTIDCGDLSDATGGFGHFLLSRMIALVAAIAIGALVAIGPAAAQTHCDGTLRPVGGGDGYKLRGDRCEGIYTRAVALGEVHLVGALWSSSHSPTIQPGRPLKLMWAAPATGKPVHVRAWALLPRLFYRMDSIRPAGAATYDWPNEVLARLKLKPADLGIVASSPLRVQGIPRDILVPVAFGPDGAESTNVELTLLSDVQLKEVYVTIFPLAADGKTGVAIHRDVPVGRGYYPANRRIRIALPAMPKPGFYRIDLGSKFMNGGAAALSEYIYVAKPKA
jgi:hypothetical protein